MGDTDDGTADGDTVVGAGTGLVGAGVDGTVRLVVVAAGRGLIVGRRGPDDGAEVRSALTRRGRAGVQSSTAGVEAGADKPRRVDEPRRVDAGGATPAEAAPIEATPVGSTPIGPVPAGPVRAELFAAEPAPPVPAASAGGATGTGSGRPALHPAVTANGRPQSTMAKNMDLGENRTSEHRFWTEKVTPLGPRCRQQD